MLACYGPFRAKKDGIALASTPADGRIGEIAAPSPKLPLVNPRQREAKS